MESLGERIRRARDEGVLARSELAARTGLSYEALYLIETDQRRPRRATIRKLAEGLGIDAHDLLALVESQVRRTVDEELRHIPRGDYRQNIFRSLYHNLREHELATDPTTPRAATLHHALEMSRTLHPAFEPAYDAGFFEGREESGQ